MTPDISTFAKAMANGYPIAAIGGREEMMRTFRFGGAAHGGTYTAHSVSLAAADACLAILDETPAPRTLAAYGERLKAGIKAILDRRGIVHSFSGHPSMFGLFFAPEPPTTTATGSARTIPSTTRSPGTCTTRRDLRAGLARAVVRLRRP